MAITLTKKLDLTGQRFGRLTALRPAENIGNRTAWLCRRGCGGEAVVKTSHLRGGGGEASDPVHLYRKRLLEPLGRSGSPAGD